MFHCFTIKFHFSFFASFRLFLLQIFRFASLWSFLLRSETKRSKIQVYFIAFFTFFAIFRILSLFFRIFCLFSLFFALHFSLRFDLVIFASKRNEPKRNSSLFFRSFRFFSLFFRFFPLFFAFFRFASIFPLNFRLFYLRFRFRFLVFRIEVNHVKSGFFFASKRSEIFASISNFASEAKVRAHPSQKYVHVGVHLQ